MVRTGCGWEDATYLNLSRQHLDHSCYSLLHSFQWEGVFSLKAGIPDRYRCRVESGIEKTHLGRLEICRWRKASDLSGNEFRALEQGRGKNTRSERERRSDGFYFCKASIFIG